MGNGAKAQQRRERGGKDAGKGGKSQLKVNEASKSIVCGTCRQSFMTTARAPALTAHAEKHSKALADCFPDFKV
ncbi:DUF1909-domain-containing protein [Schizopora paradoxa]|uniref:DUF1909-domain-containing protein n=1 Tax=Schizopora paradoxa TaxID=27342 RepID=A0A0H2S843_9AGAM|nr:DUF1909-domain-containing protein [Schizopora paradoxa]